LNQEDRHTWNETGIVITLLKSLNGCGIADRVFGPATTTRGVYDVAAQHVVSGAMQGVNGNFLLALDLSTIS
jgi:centromeric protein E